MTIARVRPPQVSRRAVWWLCAAAILLFTAGVSLHPGGESRWTAFDDIGESLTPFIALAACWTVARRSAGRERSAWALIGAGAGSWGLGQVGWTIFEVGLGTTPESPSLCDAGFLLSPLLIIAGLLLFVLTPAGLLTRLRGALEALLIAGGLLAAAWSLVLAQAVSGSDAPVSTQIVTLAYPILDVVALAALLFTVSRPRMHRFGDLGGLGAGIVALAAADATFWYLTTVKNVDSVNASGAGWFAGFLLIAVSALPVRGAVRRRWPVPRFPAASAARTCRRWLGVLLPELIALAGTTVAVVWQVVGGHRMDRPLTYLIAAMVGVAVLCGMGVLAENHVLTAGLEHRIIERTDQLAARERHYSALVENSFDATMVLSRDLVVISVSDGEHGLFGRRAEELVRQHLDRFGARFAPLVSVLESSPPAPGQVRAFTWEFLDTSGGQRFAESHITNLIDNPDVAGYIVNTRDITDRVTLEKQLRHQAFHDQLTGLANRALFNDRAEHALHRARRTGRSVAALMIDLDGFKHLNDSLGHDAGDRVLRSVAAKLTTLTRAEDTLARLGGDEFAILMEDLTTDDEPVNAAERIRMGLHKLGTTDEHIDYLVTASIGVRISDGSCSSVGDLLRDADIAMYNAKASGKDGVQHFEGWMHDKARERFQLQSELLGALERKEFALYYQPSWTLGTGELEGFEALIRWIHPRLGMILPDQFIPLAEESGLIVPIGRWVLREATRQLATWTARHRGVQHLTMSVNISARQLRDPSLPTDTRDALRAAGIPADRLILEITENALITDPNAAARRLQSLKNQGVRIAIDDFGTGYSSLSYLQNLPIDILKIDKTFVSGPDSMGSDSTDSTDNDQLLSAIITLAHTLGLATVAEGVEQTRHATLLAAQGCDSGQGYLWAAPLATEQAWNLVQNVIGPDMIETAAG